MSSGVATRVEPRRGYGEVSALQYVCPGETHAISYAVHLARRAAGFAGCQDCPHSLAAGLVALRPLRGADTESVLPGRRRTAGMVYGSHEARVRGRLLTDLDRPQVLAWSHAVAAWLWDQSPRRVCPATSDTPNSASGETVRSGAAAIGRSGPVVVVGYDDRETSPQMLSLAVLGLKTNGCQVLDIGQVTRPAWRFAVHHRPAVAGWLVTGAGGGPEWTGWDLVGRDAGPLQVDPHLAELRARAGGIAARPARTAGSVQRFEMWGIYEAGLYRHFHALRPLKVVLATASRTLLELAKRVFLKLPCGLVTERLPVRTREVFNPQDDDVQRLRQRVVGESADLGVLLDDDGETVSFVDELGQLIPQAAILRGWLEHRLREEPETEVWIDGAAYREWGAVVLAGGGLLGQTTSTVETVHALARQVSLSRQGAGISGDGRFWYRDGYAACDGLVVLANLLQRLSWSDAPASAVFGGRE